MEIPGTVWRTYRKGKCLYFNLDKISRMLKHSWLNARGLTWGYMYYKIGDPVIVYRRYKENPLKDVAFCGIITEQECSMHKERHMLRIFRCCIEDLAKEEYQEAIEGRKGVICRKNHCLPYSAQLYRNVLEFLWQMRYLITHKLYDFFPIDVRRPSTEFLGHVQGIAPAKFRAEAVAAVGLSKPKKNFEKKQGYRRIDYKLLARRLADEQNRA